MTTKIRQFAALVALLGLVASPLAVQGQNAPADRPAPSTGQEAGKEAPAGDAAKKEDEKKEEKKKDEEKKGQPKPDGTKE